MQIAWYLRLQCSGIHLRLQQWKSGRIRYARNTKTLTTFISQTNSWFLLTHFQKCVVYEITTRSVEKNSLRGSKWRRETEVKRKRVDFDESTVEDNTRADFINGSLSSHNTTNGDNSGNTTGCPRRREYI